MSAVRFVRGVFAVALLTICASPAFGFRMIQNSRIGTVSEGVPVPCDDPGGFAHWTHPTIYWYRNILPQGYDKELDLQIALNVWTSVPNANHNLVYAGTTAAKFATDGINTLSWGTGNGCEGSCLALTALTLEAGQTIVEADVTFNNFDLWDSNPGGIDTQAVALHEIGHTLGIHHTEIQIDPLPTMYYAYFGLDGRTLEADDQAALQCAQATYPIPPAPPIAPSWFDVQPEFCRGLATLTWASVEEVAYYEVQRSSSGSFTSPTQIYSGPATTLFHNGGTGTKYYRVRACNAGGCSAWRDGNRPVTYRSGCA